MSVKTMFRHSSWMVILATFVLIEGLLVVFAFGVVGHPLLDGSKIVPVYVAHAQTRAIDPST